MRELVDQQDRRPARKAGIEIELLAHGAAIPHRQCRQLLQAVQQPLGLDAAVRFDVTDDEVDTAASRTLRAASSIE